MTALTAYSIVGHIISGDFLDRARVKRIAVIFLIVNIAAFAGLLVTSRGGVDLRGRPLGPDFFAFWSAGRIASAGDAAAAYDLPTIVEFERRHFGGAAEHFAPFWSPPTFLMLIKPLSAAPFPLAWAAFSGLTFAAYFIAMRRLAPPQPLSVLLIVSAPGVLLNATHGQTGFLFAALFAALAASLDRRPLVAGVLIGLLALKPQYGLMIPLCLAVAGKWRVLGAAAAAIAASLAAATVALGVSIWPAFLANNALARHVLLETGEVRWEKNASLYAALRNFGAAPSPAYAAHGLFAAAVAAALLVLWRSAADTRLKMAGLIVASIAITPYTLDHDLLILAPAIALFASWALETGAKPYEKIAIALAWIAPVTMPTAMALKFPLGFLSLVALLLVILARAHSSPAKAPAGDGDEALSATDLFR